MGRKYIKIILFALTLMLLLPGMAAEAKIKAKTCSKDKDFNSRTDIQTKVKGVSGKAKSKMENR